MHLFRYVINTQNPTWVTREGIKVYTGQWVDQGPLGLERPCDIKALLFSNPDTNNFNNYYKFLMDSLMDNVNRNPDAITTNNPNAISSTFIHKTNRDPLPDQRFYDNRVNPESATVETIDVTDKVIYINEATGVMFVYNSSYKNDPTYGYGNRPPGWIAVSGFISR